MRRALIALLLVCQPLMAANFTPDSCFIDVVQASGMCHPSNPCWAEDEAWTTLVIFRVENTQTSNRELWSSWNGLGKSIRLRIDLGTAPQGLEVYSNAGTAFGGDYIELDTWYGAAVVSAGDATGSLNSWDLSTRPPTLLDDAVAYTPNEDPDDVPSFTIGAAGTDDDCAADPFDGDIVFLAYFREELSQDEMRQYFVCPWTFRAAHSDTVSWFFTMMDETATDHGGANKESLLTSSGTIVTGDMPPVCGAPSG